MPFESNSLVSLKQQISDGDYRQPSKPSGECQCEPWVKSLCVSVCVREREEKKEKRGGGGGGERERESECVCVCVSMWLKKHERLDEQV